MFTNIFIFELKYRLGRPATYVYFFILFLFAFVSAIYGNVPGSEKTYINSAYTLSVIILILSIFETMIASAVMGVPVYRDIEYNTQGYFMAYPINEKSYLLGRFAGSFVVLIFITLGVHFGMLLGSFFGPVFGTEEAGRYGPFRYMYYIYPTLVFTIPNMFFTGTIFFSLVALTRKIYVTYVGSVLFFIGYLLANALTSDLDYRNIVDILDPFGLTAYINATKYWTPAEQNVTMVPLAGNLLWNRLLWGSISLVIFLYTLYRFNFQRFLAVKSRRNKKGEEVFESRKNLTLPAVSKVFSQGLYFRQMFRLAGLEFRNIVRDIYFIAILLAGLLFLFLDGWFGSPTYGTPALPMTYYMLEVKDFNYIVFVFILIIFYTGEVVHRDKSVNYANISDALPVPNWLVYGSKILALIYICFILVNLVVVCGVLNQTIKGYFNYEFDKYFTDLYLIELPEYIQLVMLAFFVHILVNQKFVGHFVSIGIWVLMFGLRNIAEIDYNLFFYSSSPAYVVSDMNGFGHFFKPLFWFNAYWLSLGFFLVVIGNLFWQRGAESSWRARWQLARERWNGISGGAFLLFLALFVCTGFYNYYNVSVLNTYQTAEKGRKRQVEYEKKYKKYERIAQPKISAVNLKADIYPEERRAWVEGKFTLVNKSNRPIDSLHLNFSGIFGRTKMRKLRIGGKEPSILSNDTLLRYAIYQMPRKMLPGDTLLMEVSMDARYAGFTNSGTNSEIVENGTFFNLGVFPSFGYSSQGELTSDKYRKKYGFKKKDYNLPEQNDPFGLNNFLFNDDGDYVTFEAVLSTSPDQIAIAPGYLQKEWIKNGRRYFHYKMNSEMDLFFNISSARYQVKREVWKGSKGEKVNIEIYHHPKHQYNVGRFVEAVKASLDYFNKNFTPYQYTQLRILEFPRYANFAQSFPNTVPYSESFGWVADFSDPNKTDYAFVVTSHEVAHQWWGHQITPSYTRGANQLSESMAEYSSLMVLKKEYGEEAIQKFLKYELDSYLRGRANEDKFEDNLLQNESRPYVWYRKGGLVLYALQDLIGEENLNRGFRNFLQNAAFRQKAPFATSNEWYKYIKEVTPDSLRYFLTDNFEKICLYENRVTKAEATPLKNNQYKVKLTVQSKKIYYDGLGNEKGKGGSKDLIDIGIFTEDGKNKKGMNKKVPLYLKKHWLGPGEHTLELVITGKPVKAGIDPYNKLIDRIPDDNLRNVDVK